MKKILLAVIFYLSILIVARAQEVTTRFFELTPSKNKIQNSLYKTIGFLDSRDDTTRIGMIDIGLLKNRPAKLILKTPFQLQLTNLLNSLIDSTAKDGELLFQLNQFNFVETSGTRYCYLLACLYTKENSGYKKLSILDTTIIIPVSDVGKAIQKQGNEIIASFISKAISLTAQGISGYSINEISKMDSIEKNQIPVYATEKFTDGIYLNYESFKNQKPDLQGMIETKKDGSISSIHIIDSTGKKVKAKSKNMYAVINNGKIFIATQFGYYLLEKINNNFIFTGEINIAASNGDVNAAQFGFGITGALLAKGGNRETFMIMLDYINGHFIHQARIKTIGDE
ncbi:MAG TPA: hypothetical protein VKT28_14930 [Puia sp.]|nr:hypothetical protein [Puia sp.]